MPRIRVHVDPETGVVRYGVELVLPARYAFTVEDYTYALTAEVTADRDGPRITSLKLDQVDGGPAVTTDGVRRLPLGRLLRSSVELAAWAPLRDREGRVMPLLDEEGNVVVDDDGNVVSLGRAQFASPEELARAEREVAGAQRRWLLTDEHLRDVAKVYRANPRDARGKRAPTVAVMEHFGVTRPTAGRWVMETRKRGFLPPANQTGNKLPPVKKARKR